MCIFQSEQVNKLRFWLNNNLADVARAQVSWIIMWGAPKPNNIAQLKTALLQYGMICQLPQEFTDKATLWFRKRLRFCVAAAGGHFEHSV